MEEWVISTSKENNLKKKRTQNEIYKIPLEKIIESNYELKDYSDEVAVSHGEIVKIMDNLVFKKIRDYYDEHKNDEEKSADELAKDIVNIVVPTDKSGEKLYEELANKGFKINGVELKRLMSGGGQIRRNTVTFIKEKLYEYVLKALLCGLTLEDFGDNFNAAKFNAYLGLYMSGCLLLKGFPRVCIIDDYEEIIPEMEVNYIRSEDIRYLVLPDGDYKLSEIKDDFTFYDEQGGVTTELERAITAIRNTEVDNENATEWKVFEGKRKYPEVIKYNEIGRTENSNDTPAPPLNCFDGQGLANPKWVKKVADELGFDYVPSQMIIRAPWVKGMVATFPISEYLKSKGIVEVVSSFGDRLKVDEVDIFISKSQFKMHKIYQKKVENLEEKITAWEYHQKSMKDNGLLWGVVMPNKKEDDSKKESNYQYNQALNLETDEDIDELTKLTEQRLLKLCKHDVKQVFRTLLIDSVVEESEHNEEDVSPEGDEKYQTLLQKVVEHNEDFLGDKYIQSLINKECESKFKNAMLGKLIFKGNFQFIVSDPMAQAEWIYKNHTTEENRINLDVKVQGLVEAGQIYSNYWKNIARQEKKISEQIVLMRSPLIDQHEIAKMDLMLEEVEEFKYLQSGIVLSIHDLITLQMQNCDFDGDRCFSSNMKILKKGCLEKTYPLYFEPGKSSIEGSIDDKNIIEADSRGLNSKVGKYSNKSTSLYAMLPLYEMDSKEHKSLMDSITVLGEIVGTEIDKIKTAIAPELPYNWKVIQIPYEQKEGYDGKIEKVSKYSEEQTKAIYHHNELVPNKKPYFFRYNYPYLDKDIKSLDYEINKECKYNYGMKLAKVISEYDNEEFYIEVIKIFEKMEKEKEKNPEYELSKEEVLKTKIYSTLKKYKRTYPVLDTNCISNRICHKFEKLQEKYSDFNDGRNMLQDYCIEDMEFQKFIIEKIVEYVGLYKKQRKFITRNNNVSNEKSGRMIAKETKERLDSLLEYIRKQIYELFGNEEDKKVILNYMLKAVHSDEVRYIWQIMDVDLLEVIPKKVKVKGAE